MVKTEARLSLLDADPLAIPSLESEDILKESLKLKRYDMAWVVVKEFGHPPYELLECITTDAILADKLEEMDQDALSNGPQWAEFNRHFVSNLDAKHAIHWKAAISYTELALQQSPTDSKVLRSVAWTFLKYSVKIPQWLESRYSAVNLGDFLLALIEFGDLQEAFNLLLPRIDAAIGRVAGTEPDLILPYTQIDLLIHMASKSNVHSKLIDETKLKMEKFFNCRNAVRTAAQMIR